MIIIISENQWETGCTGKTNPHEGSIRFIRISFLNFLVFHSVENFVDLINILRVYQRMEFQMSLKTHFLHHHPSIISTDPYVFSDGHEESCNLKILKTKTRHLDWFNPNMMDDYSWFLQ